VVAKGRPNRLHFLKEKNMREYFRYIKDLDGSFGAIGVKEVEGGKFKVGISLCSKDEPRFDKKIARDIVNQRIDKSEEFTFFEVIDNKVFDRIKKSLPHWKDDWDSPVFVVEFTLRRIAEDILMDYAKDRYYEIKK
jgi:hypothetical protein